MSDKELIETLRKAAQSNPALGDTLHMFALRKRARFIVTLAALQAKMAEEGFKHSREAYADVLTLLAATGIGTLDKDPKGKVRALKAIKVSIPALGKAVLANGVVKGYRQRTRYVKPQPAPVPEQPREARQPRTYQVRTPKVIATVLGNSGQVIANVTFNADATEQDIAEFFKKQLEGHEGPTA